jgi:hypothetical protein
MQAGTNYVARLSNWELRQKFIAEHHPLRIIDGKLYDFTPLFVAMDTAEPLAPWKQYVVYGKVMNVIAEGGLLLTGDDGLVTHIKNYVNERAVVDGSQVRAVCMLVGRYQYTSTTGSQKTVFSYDCGRYYDPEKDSAFTNKFLVDFIGPRLVRLLEIDHPMPKPVTPNLIPSGQKTSSNDHFQPQVGSENIKKPTENPNTRLGTP